MSDAPIELAQSEIAELIKENATAKKVYDWMKGRNIFIRGIKSVDSIFQFEGKTETQIGFVITQPKSVPRSIIVVSNLEIPPRHFELMTKLPPREKDDFLWDLKEDLIFAPATFFMVPDLNSPKSIQFAKELSFDELSEGRLIEAMDAVCRSTIWTIWMLVRKFGQPEEEAH
ncbi:MAG: DUF2299 family protein [Methanotrichaceae archaeon]|jgi:hypothetical protein